MTTNRRLRIPRGNDALIPVVITTGAIHYPLEVPLTEETIDLSKVRALTLSVRNEWKQEPFTPEYQINGTSLEISLRGSDTEREGTGKYLLSVAFELEAPTLPDGWRSVLLEGELCHVITENTQSGQEITPLHLAVLPILRGEKGTTGERGEQGLQGEQGRSAYQSYLDSTSDNPPLSEAQWADRDLVLCELLKTI